MRNKPNHRSIFLNDLLQKTGFGADIYVKNHPGWKEEDFEAMAWYGYIAKKEENKYFITEKGYDLIDRSKEKENTFIISLVAIFISIMAIVSLMIITFVQN